MITVDANYTNYAGLCTSRGRDDDGDGDGDGDAGYIDGCDSDGYDENNDDDDIFTSFSGVCFARKGLPFK